MITQFKILDTSNNVSIDPSFTAFVAQLKQVDFSKTDSISELSEELGIFELQDHKLFLHLLLEGVKSSLHFDLDEGSVGFRAKSVSKNNELIARAIGCKSHYRPRVLDATAGMGRDSFIMAKLGCCVLMQERCTAIYLLLNNALKRLYSSQPEIEKYLILENTNSIDSLKSIEKFDVIYLDPMFPSRKKSALVKKEMRLFKMLAGNDLDAGDLLKRSLKSGAKRVVVKRPKGAPQIDSLKPSHEINSKNFRFDVYLI